MHAQKNFEDLNGKSKVRCVFFDLPLPFSCIIRASCNLRRLSPESSQASQHDSAKKAGISYNLGAFEASKVGTGKLTAKLPFIKKAFFRISAFY